MISISNIKWDMWHSTGKLLQGQADRSWKDISTASIYLRHSWKITNCSSSILQHPPAPSPSNGLYLNAAFRSLGRCESSTGCGKQGTAHFPAIPPQMCAQQHKSCIFFKAWWKLQIPSYCFVKRHRISNPVSRSLLVMILFSSFLFILPDLFW